MRWPRFLRVYDESGRSVRVKYRYLLLMIAAFAFVGIAAIYLPVAMTSTPSFCANCHVMQEPKDLWEDSTHGNVNCIACHVEPGFMKQLEHKVLSYKEIYTQIFKGAEMAPDVKRPTNASCLQCHNIDRVVSTGGDIKIPHRQHVEMQGLQCADCHFNVVHTRKGIPGGAPPMDVCYMCHDGVKAPNACTTCHVNPPDKTRGASHGCRPEPWETGAGAHRGLPPVPQRAVEVLRELPQQAAGQSPSRFVAIHPSRAGRGQRQGHVLRVPCRRTSARSATRCSIRRTGCRRTPSSPRVAGNRVGCVIRRLSATAAMSRRE